MANQLKHIALILDGNGRWAKKRGLDRSEGHKAGAENVIRIARHLEEKGVQVLSLYAFSTENWKRPQKEISALLQILASFLKAYLGEFMEKKVQLRIMGDLSAFDFATRQLVNHALSMTQKNQGLILNIGLNYGGQAEILRAFRRALAAGEEIQTMEAKDFSKYLDTQGLPPVDLMVRTGGEHRLSNFLLWQLAYTELAFSDTLWPDFSLEELDQILQDFAGVNRRYGGL